MGLKDTLEFSEHDYAVQIANENVYTTQRLKTQEVFKLRQQVSGGASIGIGLLFAPHSMGLSLVGSAYGARRLYIAKKKLALIEEELKKREVSLYTPRKRDYLIPLGASVAALGFGAGVDAAAAHFTSQATVHMVSDHGTQAVVDAIQHPGAFLHAVGQGLSLQTHEFGQAVAGGLQHAAVAANVDSSFIMMGAASANPATLVGLASGVSAAHLTEARMAKWSSGKIAVRFIDPLLPNGKQAFSYAKRPASCARWAKEQIICSFCSKTINCAQSDYYHCCDCDGDLFEACTDCIEHKNKGCRQRDKHVLFRVLKDNSDPKCKRFPGVEGNSLAQLPICNLLCSKCLRPLGLEDYYHCCQCDDDDFDLCRECFAADHRCHDIKHGSLLLIPEPRPAVSSVIGLKWNRILSKQSYLSPTLVNRGNQEMILAWTSKENNLMVATAGLDGLSNVRPVSNVRTTAPPSLAHDDLSGTTYVAWSDRSYRRNLTITRSVNGTRRDWDAEITTEYECAFGPGLAFVQKHLVVVWAGRVDQQINIGVTNDYGINWSRKVMRHQATGQPTVTTIGSTFLLAWRGENNQMYTCCCEDLGSLMMEEPRATGLLGQGTVTSHMEEDGNVAAWAAENFELMVNTNYHDYGLSCPLEQRTDCPPSLCRFRDKMMIAWKGLEDDFLRIAPECLAALKK